MELRYNLDWGNDSFRRVLTPSTFARDYLFFVQEVGSFQSRSKYYTERVGLESYLILYTIKGKGYLSYNDRDYKLIPGSIFFIDCMQEQRYYTDPVDMWEGIWFHFFGASARGYYQEFTSRINGNVKQLPGHSQAKNKIRDLIEISSHPQRNNELIASSVIVDLLTDLLVTSSENLTEIPFGPIADVVQYLAGNKSAAISLDDLSELFSYNKYYLIRLFKKHTGLTPIQYHIMLKINFAKELLIHTTASLSEISEQIGIDYTSHFISLFKKNVGLTPTAYRRKWSTSLL